MSLPASAFGTGWAFPVAVDRRGSLPVLGGIPKIRQSILLILLTEPGERVMLPTFGAGLRRYLAMPNTVAIRAVIQRDVELALSTWEPRLELGSVEVTPGDDPAMVLISINYTLARDGTADNLVVPLSLS
jgi:uncharacterized protein